MNYLPWIVIFVALIALFFSQSTGGGTIAMAAPFPFDAGMRIVTSLAVLVSALYVILSHSYGDAEQKWAFGAIGTLLGYWLKR